MKVAAGAATLMAVIGMTLAVTARAQVADPYTVESGQQARTWQETRIRRDIPIPIHRIFKDNAEEVLIVTLEASPWKPAKAIGIGYHVQYFTRKSIDKALDAGNQDARERLILIGQDAARLKQLIDAGKNPDTDKEAGTLYLKLQKQITDESTTWSFAGKALLNHLPYAVVREGYDELISFGIGKWTARIGINHLFKRLGFARDISKGWREEVKLANELFATRWFRLNARAQEVRTFFDAYQKALLDFAIGKQAGKYSNQALDKLLAQIEEDIRKKHPSNPAPAPSGPILVRGNLRQLVQIQPVAMAQVAAAAPVAVFVAPPPVAAVARIPDPVVQTIYREDSFVYERRSSSSTTESSSSTSSNDPPPAQQQQPPEHKRSWGWSPPKKGPNWDGRKAW